MSNDKLQKIMESIYSPDIKVISFDLFDTLVLRPILSESQKFELLNKVFWKNVDSQISFSKIRERAEAYLRRKIIRKEMDIEDISLVDIYDVIEKEYAISHDVVQKMIRAECEIEEKLCYPRQYGKRLYQESLKSGKKMILISDMYLNKETIIRILEKNGYRDWDAIYVSSECGLRKITGNLYRQVILDMKVKPEEIIHIGDNEISDYQMAQKCGIKGIYVPAPWEAYKKHNCAHQVEKICTDLIDWEKASSELGVSTFRKMAANKYFDNPFRKYVEESDYNVDPFFVGYAALGPEVLALVKWIISNMERDGVEEIVFLARDGYLPMQVYEKYRKFHPELPEAEYLYVSRIALLPAMIRTPQDFFDLPVDISFQTPEKIIRLLDFCVKKSSVEKLFEIYPKDMQFDSETFEMFISNFIKFAYDRERHNNALDNIKQYIINACRKVPSPRVAIFDLGYSGRIAAALSYVLEDVFPVYYFHGDGCRQFQSENRNGFKIRTFLDFNPYMEATLREYSYLEPSASCVGYDFEHNPIFDEGMALGYEKTVRDMQQGAFDFVDEYLTFFVEYEPYLPFRFHSAAMFFESFLRFCSMEDRKIYDGILIDDVLWGGRRDIDLKKLMEARLRKLPEYAK